jgi:hypothetical protein
LDLVDWDYQTEAISEDLDSLYYSADKNFEEILYKINDFYDNISNENESNLDISNE